MVYNARVPEESDDAQSATVANARPTGSGGRAGLPPPLHVRPPCLDDPDENDPA